MDPADQQRGGSAGGSSCGNAGLSVAARRWRSLAVVPRIVPHGVIPMACRNGAARAMGGIYFEHDGPCKHITRHRRCRGRWRGEITLRRSPAARRLRRRVSGPNKAAVQDALKELRKEIDGGITKVGSGSYRVRRCCEDWLAGGQPGRDPITVAKNRYVLEPLLAVIGPVRLTGPGRHRRR